MKISDAYPGNYLKAGDLQNKAVKLTMEKVQMEDIGDDNKPVLYFGVPCSLWKTSLLAAALTSTMFAQFVPL